MDLKLRAHEKRVMGKICRESWLCWESGNGEGRYYWVPFQLFRLKYAFSQEEKTLQFILPNHNSLALIITKCGSICFCTCDGCQQHWKAVIGGGKKRKKSCVCWSRAQWSISDACIPIIALLCFFLWIRKRPINKLVGEQWFCMLNSLIASSQWDCALSELDSWKIHILVIKLDFIYKYWLRGFPSRKLWFLFPFWWA